MWKQVAYTNSGLKVFMDARMPVTHKEGDRYPLGPPDIFHSSTAVVQLTVNQLVVGSIPACGAIFRIHSAKNLFSLFMEKKKSILLFFLRVA